MSELGSSGGRTRRRWRLLAMACNPGGTGVPRAISASPEARCRKRSAGRPGSAGARSGRSLARMAQGEGLEP